MKVLHVFGRFIGRYYTMLTLLDLIEMAMRYFHLVLSKIVALSKAIVPTFIFSEIPIQKLIYKLPENSRDYYSHWKLIRQVVAVSKLKTN